MGLTSTLVRFIGRGASRDSKARTSMNGMGDPWHNPDPYCKAKEYKSFISPKRFGDL